MALPSTGSHALIRTLKARAILDALARDRELTRSELIAATGLSRTAVTQVLRALEHRGAVRTAGVDRATRGPAAARFTLAPDLGFALAVHIERESLHLALVDVLGRVRAERGVRDVRYEDRAAKIEEFVREFLAEQTGRVLRVVVGMPGVVTAAGELRDERGPDGGAFQRQLAQRLGCSVLLENDINLAAVAEFAVGAAQGMRDFVLLSIGEGAGAAVMIDGELHRGVRGLAGEIGYLPQPGVTPGVPVLGDEVYEDLARAQGLDPAAPLTAHLDAAAGGEPRAMAVVDAIAERAHVLAATVALTIDPQVFLVGGYAAHPVLLARLQERAEEYAHLLPLTFELAHGGSEATLTGAIVRATEALREGIFDRLVASPERKRP